MTVSEAVARRDAAEARYGVANVAFNEVHALGEVNGGATGALPFLREYLHQETVKRYVSAQRAENALKTAILKQAGHVAETHKARVPCRVCGYDRRTRNACAFCGA